MPSTQNILQKLAAHAKDHHESVNAAFVAVHSPGSSRPSPRPSMDSRQSASTTSTSTSSTPSNFSKAWKSIKRHVKEHHESLNAAYATYYAPGMIERPSSVGLRSSTSTVVSLPVDRNKTVYEIDVVEKAEKD